MPSVQPPEERAEFQPLPNGELDLPVMGLTTRQGRLREGGHGQNYASIQFFNWTAYDYFAVERTFDSESGLVLHLIKSEKDVSKLGKHFKIRKTAMGRSLNMTLTEAFKMPKMVPDVSRMPIDVAESSKTQYGCRIKFKPVTLQRMASFVPSSEDKSPSTFRIQPIAEHPITMEELSKRGIKLSSLAEMKEFIELLNEVAKDNDLRFELDNGHLHATVKL